MSALDIDVFPSRYNRHKKGLGKGARGRTQGQDDEGKEKEDVLRASYERDLER